MSGVRFLGSYVNKRCNHDRSSRFCLLYIHLLYLSRPSTAVWTAEWSVKLSFIYLIFTHFTLLYLSLLCNADKVVISTCKVLFSSHCLPVDNSIITNSKQLWSKQLNVLLKSYPVKKPLIIFIVKPSIFVTYIH